MCSESSVMSSVMSPHVNEVNELTTSINFGSQSVFFFISDRFCSLLEHNFFSLNDLRKRYLDTENNTIRLEVHVDLQVASRVLGIPRSKIHISETSTNTVPNASPTAASASSDLNGAAVQNACETLLKRLEPYQTKNPKASWEDRVSSSFFSF